MNKQEFIETGERARILAADINELLKDMDIPLGCRAAAYVILAATSAYVLGADKKTLLGAIEELYDNAAMLGKEEVMH